MAETTRCPQCGTNNDAGASFCAGCGTNLAPQIHCPSCNMLNGLGQRFCTRCGGSLENAGWDAAAAGAPGAVIDGVWERGTDELIRRVEPDEARRFLGTRTVRVPPGTVGVILIDGVVERVLPPGEQTSLGLFQRLANFFLRRERTAFYLVDQRPFPVPFVVRTRPDSSGRVVKSQVLVTFSLPRGDRQALGVFIANVLGDRPSFPTGDLYNLLRPEVARISQDALERAAATGEVSYPDAEAAIRVALAQIVGPRYGLTVEATLAPLTAISSLTFHLGTGVAPRVRNCVGCAHELPVSLTFCDVCGAKQPVLTSTAPPTAESPLFTSDGQQVELDLVVRVQGTHDDVMPGKIAPALVGAVAAHLRAVAFPALTAPGGFAALETAVTGVVTETVQSFGLTLVALSVVDVRSKTGQWLLSARADLDRATEDVRLGLSWLEQRDTELDLQELTITRVLREQAMRRDQAFSSDAVAVADRERREVLADRAAAIDIAATQRDAATRAAAIAAEQERARRGVTHDLELRKTKLEAELGELRARRDLDFADLERRKRLELDLAAVAEQQQIDKLRAMAEIDRQSAAQDQAHELEKRTMLRGLTPEEMIALQAAELARSEGGGAAWANAVAARGNADLERRHAEETRGVYDKAMGAMADVAKSRAEAAPVVAGGSPSISVASTQADPPPTKACASCAARIKLDAKFCGTCGSSQV